MCPLIGDSTLYKVITVVESLRCIFLQKVFDEADEMSQSILAEMEEKFNK